MKYLAYLTLSLVTFVLSGCSTMKVDQYIDEKPELDLFEFFKGTTYAQGQFQDRSGVVLRRFSVDINGVIDGDTLTLDEQFLYNDGETQQRIWKITRVDQGRYIGRADDVIGEAKGESAGNALNWRYTLDLPYNDSSIHVKFDDWMFLQSDTTMINRAEVSKWGFSVGEVTLFFNKRPL